MDYHDPELNLDFGDALIEATNKMGEWRDNYGFSGREVLDTKSPRRPQGKGPTQPSPGLGISWDKRKQKWVVQITYYEAKQKRTVYVGAYEDTPEGVLEAKNALHDALDDLIQRGKKSPESKMKYAA